MKHRIGFIVGALLCVTVVQAGMTPRDLRCESRVNPLGIDVMQPHLSWVLESDERGQRQTGYQVLVASSQQLLSEGKGDLWDSGKVASDETLHVEYAGKPLTSEMRAVWKVRVFDKDGTAPAWSEPASFSMGLLDPKDWQAKWIGAKEKRLRVAPNGFHALEAKTDSPKWVQVDLGKPVAIEQVRLYPARPNNWKPDTPGFGFPPAGRIEVADDEQFAKSTLIAEWTESKRWIDGDKPIDFNAKKMVGRFVRVTSEHLWKRNDGSLCFALAELEAIADGKNVALGAPVTASDSVENHSGWAKSGLTDGHSPASPRDLDEEFAAPLFRKSFELNKPVARATLSICGLGYHLIDINGQRIGDHQLDPGFAQFDKRVLYVTHDVTAALRSGRNAIGVTLGGGWWDLAQPELFGFEHAPWNAPPKLLLRMKVEFADGSSQVIATDESWKQSTGEIRFNDVRAGETVDFTKAQRGWNTADFDDSTWKPALVVPAPSGKLAAQFHPPIKICGEIPAVEQTEPQRGVYQFKLAENTGGWPRLKVAGTRGQKISMKCAEDFDPDGKVSRGLTQHTFGRYQTDEFILADDSTVTLQPHFTYHGFQYVRVTGLKAKPQLADLVGLKVHTALEPAGEFACSDETINQVHAMCVRTYLANLHGIPTDCPQREKAGWMADGLVASVIGMSNFRDADLIYRKWIRDMADAQLADGNVPSIIPNPGWHELLDPWWGGASVMLPWELYQRYGDERVLREQFPTMKRYVDYLTSRSKDHLVEWSLGDWLEVGAGSVANRTPVTLTSSMAYFRCATIVSDVAKLIGEQADADEYARLAGDIRTAINGKFFDEKHNRYARDSQSASAMALQFGVALDDRRDAIFDELLRNIREDRKNHISSGLVGTLFVLRALCERERNDVAWSMATQEDFPGWIHMLKSDEKTIWESWDGVASRNHPALGVIDAWFYEGLAGIRPAPASGFAKVKIAPPRQALPNLTWARGTYNSPRGEIASDWKRDGKRFELKVKIPPNVTAEVFLPAGSTAALTESGRAVGDVSEISQISRDEQCAVLMVPSGSYKFVAEAPQP